MAIDAPQRSKTSSGSRRPADWSHSISSTKHISRNNVKMTQSPASGSRSSLLFTLQFTCAEDGLERRRDDSSNDQYDPVLELAKIQKVLAGLSEAEQQLSATVQEAKASSILATGGVDLWAIGSHLRSKHGYLIALRRANVAQRPKAYLRQLRHDFLVVRGLQPTSEGCPPEVLVDLNFRDHFRVAHATPWYTKLLAALPQDWVGSAQALAPLVGLMSAGIRLCFRQAGIPLPPWRDGRAMLSKWVTELHVDEPLPVVPVPDPTLRRLLAPYHKPFRTARKQQDQQPQQQQQQQHGQAAGQAFSQVAPPPTSSAATAAAANPAPHAPDAAPHHRLVPDVPRRIIVGFPVATPPSAGLQQQQQLADALDWAGDFGFASGHNSNCRPELQQQQQSPEARPTQPVWQQQQQHTNPAAPRAAAPASPAAAAGCKPPGRPPAQAGPRTCENTSAHSQNAAAAGGAGAPAGTDGRTPAAARVRPAFASTAGVIVATAGGTSPGIVVNKQWVQQLTEGVMAAGSAEKGKALAAGAPAAAATGGVGAIGGSSSDGQAGPTAAPAGSAAVRQFKSLDQLLPRMRTVKLGAG